MREIGHVQLLFSSGIVLKAPSLAPKAHLKYSLTKHQGISLLQPIQQLKVTWFQSVDSEIGDEANVGATNTGSSRAEGG